MQLTFARRFLGLAFLASGLALPGCSADTSPEAEELVSADEDAASTEDALTGNRAVGSALQTTANLNLRVGASTTQRILLTMPVGARVTVVRAAPAAGWYNVKYGATTGWASGLYLKAPAAAGGGGAAKTVTISGPAVRPHVQKFANAACAAVGCPYAIGTRVGHDPTGDRAIDMMQSVGGVLPPDGGGRGTRLANFAVTNQAAHKLYYVIWQQRINTLDGRGWRGMENRGSITQNHFDHVHVSFDP
jgi:hypothetical protein